MSHQMENIKEELQMIKKKKPMGNCGDEKYKWNEKFTTGIQKKKQQNSTLINRDYAIQKQTRKRTKENEQGASLSK